MTNFRKTEKSIFFSENEKTLEMAFEAIRYPKVNEESRIYQLM